MTRCAWAKTPLSIAYHDAEWGVPVHDDRVHFEFLVLEGAQAGLSWETILAKRDHYRKAFAGFDPARVARFTPARTERLLINPGLVRNRLKIRGAVTNARAFLRVQREFGSFDAFLWSRVNGTPVVNRWRSLADVPARTALSDDLSRDLRRRGFTFVGSTICYAFLQAVGVVDDHLARCDCRTARGRPRRDAPAARRPADDRRYVAFLRGINLGRRRIEMATLRALFEDLGFADVITFIASGNVLFTAASGDRGALEQRIECHLKERLGYEVDTFVRTAGEVEHMAALRAFPSRDEAAAHAVYVTLLRAPLAVSIARRLEACRTSVDAFHAVDREYYWLCRVRSSESAVWTLPEVKALKLPVGTMRNVSTLRRIAEMLKSGT
jgi:DNA-3-methyladenine glycosylase I